MTRKEKEAQIRFQVEESLARPLGIHAGNALVAFVLAELEAVGQTWDPELEEMRLEATETGAYCGWRIAPAGAAEMYPFTYAQAREIIRRYEALAKVRSIIADGPCICATTQQAEAERVKILAIIDGKETP